LYASLTTATDANGVPIPNQSLLSKANKILADQATSLALFHETVPQLSEADIKAATQRLTAKVLFNAAKAHVLARLINSVTYVPTADLPATLRDGLLEDVRHTLGLGIKEANAIVDGLPSYELKLAVTELTAQITIRRMQQFTQSTRFTMVEKQLAIRELLSDVPNLDVIKATPTMRDYLHSLHATLTEANTALASVRHSFGAGNKLLTETLERTLTAQELQDTIGRYYEADVTDARFAKGLTAQQLKALETPLVEMVGAGDFNLEDIPTEYAGDIDRYVNEQNKHIRSFNENLIARRENVKQQIKANKTKYFETLPGEERLLAKVRYFLSVENTEGLWTIESLLTDSWVSDINHLPANKNSVVILNELQEMGPKSLATIIDQVVTHPAFGASEFEVDSYLKAGGIRGLLARETASSVRGRSLRNQLSEIKHALDEAASRRASLLGVKVAYRQNTTPFIPNPRLYENLSRHDHELVSQHTVQSQTQVDANGNRPLTELHNIANVLAKIILKSSKSYAMGDIIVATEAVLRALELGQFSRLPGLHNDAIAKARLGTIDDWQHRLTITADDIAHELTQLLSPKLAEIILQRSKSHAMGDLVVATQAILAGTYDAIEQ
ncbi:MAG: hypothetical protein ORN21_00890, partial [Methylophilaceae bacterium]|nr:hypothetical protein [Methylophilaceae bacterium]